MNKLVNLDFDNIKKSGASVITFVKNLVRRLIVSQRKYKKIYLRALRVLLIIVATPPLIILSMRWIDPPTTSFIMQFNAAALLQPRTEQGWAFARHNWTDYEHISDHMIMAVIAAEDQRFVHHHGLDTAEIGKVLVSQTDRRGASTITQQTAKNLFLWSGRSYIRKAMEAVLALLMELCLSKQRILEIYLNIAETGTGQFGVTDAAMRYFKKSPAKLNKHEAARIAAILPNPKEYSATNPDSYVLRRQRWIIRQMNQLGGVSYLQNID